MEINKSLLEISILSWTILARLDLTRLTHVLLKLLEIQWPHLDCFGDGRLICCLSCRRVSGMWRVNWEVGRHDWSHLRVLMPVVMVHYSTATGVLVTILMVCSRSAWHPTEACATSPSTCALLLPHLLLIDVFVASLLTPVASLSSITTIPTTVSSTCEPTIQNTLVYGVSSSTVHRTSIGHKVLIKYIGLIFHHIWLRSITISLSLFWWYSVSVQIRNIYVVSDLVALIMPARQVLLPLIVSVWIQFEIEFEPVIEHDTMFLFELLIIMHDLHLIPFQFS